MADLTIEGTDLVVALSPAERLAALRDGPRAALTEVLDVEVVADAHRHVQGMRLGMALPGLLIAGTFFSGDKGEAFAVCHRSRPGLVVTLRGASPRLLVVSVDAPDQVAARLRSACGIPPKGTAAD